MLWNGLIHLFTKTNKPAGSFLYTVKYPAPGSCQNTGTQTGPVSYTHLDVYKRQVYFHAGYLIKGDFALNRDDLQLFMTILEENNLIKAAEQLLSLIHI